jgi:hypothetical protein
MTQDQRWKIRPEGSNWGDFGPNDQIGRLNLITPERRKAAAEEVREGIVFCLSLPLDCPRVQMNPRRFPPQMAFSMRGEDPVMNYPYGQVSACNIRPSGMRCATWAMSMTGQAMARLK